MTSGTLTRVALLAAVVVGLTLADNHTTTPLLPFRVCTDSNEVQDRCTKLKQIVASLDNSSGVTLDCTKLSSYSKCLFEVGQGKYDVTFVYGRDVYSAGKTYDLYPVVGLLAGDGLTSDNPFLYASVAVMRKNSAPEILSVADLRGRRSCHTAVGRNMAWALPLSYLNTEGLITGAKDCLDNVENAAKFFSQSCAPGSQNPFYNSLREPIENLCLSCGSPPSSPKYCTEQDIYANYSGDYRCLIDNTADVAFSTQGMIEQFTAGATEVGQRAQDFELLCLDGSRKSLSEYRECNWGYFGNDALMISPKRADDLPTLRDFLLKLEDLLPADSIPLFRTENSVFGNDTFGFQDPMADNYTAVLGPDMYRMMVNQTIPCTDGTPSVMRWCTISPQEAEKCARMAVAFDSDFIKPSVECVAGDSLEGCMKLIKDGDADLINIDGGVVYTAGSKYGLKPIIYEDYGTKDATYFSVAVAKKSNPSLNFKNLKGSRSCHTGIGRTAGWNVPMAELINEGQIDLGVGGNKCNHLVPVSKFFNESCAPGAMDDKKTAESVKNLCALCKGEGSNFCSLSDKEPYFGYVGALRCLVEGSGDVAFINHLTVSENVDGKNTADWAKNLKANDFELLCKDGTRQPVDQAANCNLARVPSHAIVTAGDKTALQVNAFVQALAKGEAFFTPKSINFEEDFVLFGTGQVDEPKDILFRDGTVTLRPLPVELQDYIKYLGTYINTAKFMDCPKSS